ncbi:MAG TPA: YdbL family protein [Dongiaceae bacterium]|nr:YdbL family protein [Dongiaceae bacterium]
MRLVPLSHISRSILRGLAVFLAAFTLLTASASAETLDGARAKGLVGERPDGYVGPVGAPSPDIQSLIASVNAQRLAKYQSIAKQKGVPVEQIGALTAEKLINENLQPGWYYMDSGGNWVKK